MNKHMIGLTVTAILLVTLTVAGCAPVDSHAGNPASYPDSSQNSTGTGFFLTTAPSYGQPTELSLSQLTGDFAADPVEAEATYGGQRYRFPSVYVDDVSSLFKPTNPDTFVMNGKVKFQPRYSSSLSDIPINSIVDIEGTVWKVQSSFLIIRDCIYTVVDATNGWERPDFQSTFA